MVERIGRVVTCCLVIVLCAAGLSADSTGSRVVVVVGERAPDVERFAASELCGYLNKLFGLTVQPTTSLDASASAVFLIGSPASNALIKKFPKVGEQGIVIQRAQTTTPTLIVGGGSSSATLWAVYELAERWGVRYLLDRDALPAKSAFRMPSLNVVMEPIFRVRAHPTIQD